MTRLVLAFSLACLVAALFAGTSARATRRSTTTAGTRTPIQIENSRRGFAGWADGLFDSSAGTTSAPILGYASEISVLPGQVLRLHVSVDPAAPYRIQAFRLGWYQGLGARLLSCIPGCRRSKSGSTQPIPTPDPATGEITARWPVTDRLRTGRKWLSGYYIAKLVVTGGSSRGEANYVPFVIRAGARSSSPILVEASVNTWQAYNGWGGKSLYNFNSRGGPATKVSFDRPFSGDNSMFAWEYSFVRFLERSGYDVTYTTDVDTDRDPGQLLRHRLVIDSGHGEYWSKRMRDAFEAARARGINLAFLGADIGDLQIRYEDARRTIVEYRSANRDPEPNPALKTTDFRQLSPPRPQCELLGIEYQGGLRFSFASPTDYRVNPAALGDRWFKGTGFTASSTLRGLVGYEWDGVKAGCETPPLTVLFHASGPPNADAVRYVAASGARIFSSGSLQFVWGLDDWHQTTRYEDARLVRFMRNALNDLSR
jgi:hypothetical protein